MQNKTIGQKMVILVLENNEILANGLKQKLQQNGFAVDVFNDGRDGMYALEQKEYDMLLLDLGLPGLDGIDIIKKLRNSNNNLPILVISARDRLDQRILGLDVGADDYLCKPFELDEVIARIQAILRRINNNISNTIKYNDLEFNSKHKILKKSGKEVELKKRELEVFEYLLQNINGVVSKDDIVEHITSFDDDLNPTAIETYISRLRKKLKDSVNITNIRGIGYMMK